MTQTELVSSGFCGDGANISAGAKLHGCLKTLINGSATGCAVTFGFNGARREDDGLALGVLGVKRGLAPRLSRGLAGLGGQAVQKL
jgi:hypothetical protein